MRFGAEQGAYRLLTVVFSAVGVIWSAVFAVLMLTLSYWFFLPLFAGALAATAAAAVYPKRFVRSLYGELSGNAVTLYSGVWWKREVYLPLSQLRTFENWTLPLGRAFDCSIVVLRFAGGTVRIPLIPCYQADQLTMLLSEDPP